jgi:uncharacterized membrane protein YcaP (DUF421 family)
VPTIAAGFLLAILHRLLGVAAHRWPWTNNCLKGHSQVLLENARIDSAAMRKHNIGEDDLREALRLNGLSDYAEAKRATLERSGEISVIPAERH